MLGFVAPAGRERMLGYGRYEDVIATLDAWLSAHDTITGDGFTAADVFVGSQIGFGMTFGTIEKRPAFEQFWQRISTRPAAIRAREIDDALVAGQ